MKKNGKYMPVIVAVCVFWIAVSLFCWLKPSENFSDSERRKLAQFPDLSVDNILYGNFMSDFESYTLDQFPHRDAFRTLKAISSFYLFRQKDNNGIYIADGYAAKLEYPLNEQSVISAGEKLSSIYDKYIENAGSNVFVSVVPDKGYFLAEKNGYPALDYSKMVTLLCDNMPFAEYINIFDTLELADYYKTDTHWRQENITETAQELALRLGVFDNISWEYSVNEADNTFYGVYYGQSALPLVGEKIEYLRNDTLDSMIVTSIETDKIGGVYDLEKLSSRDPYEMFLWGSAAVLTVENPSAETSRELIVFRDSFGSSIIPLICEGYSKVTLVDTRYIASDYIGNYVNFSGQDVLFLYSSLILNSSTVLK